MEQLGSLAQDAGSMMPLRLSRSQTVPYASLFENNNYLRLLNQLLLMELGAAELYQKCSPSIQIIDREQAILKHQQHARSLTLMIISNRGIPDRDKFSFSSEISLLASRIGRHLPNNMARRTSLTSCLQLEKALDRRYQQAIQEAPYRDRAALAEHSHSIQGHIASLQAPVRNPS